MKTLQIRVLALISVFLIASFPVPVSANTLQLVVADDKTTGYNRALFKHWIDADKDGCDTRAEVLIEEAVTKPKVGTKCLLTGGKWVSAYDGVEVTSATKLDVDHMVPLAEAWRSGAWKWTAVQRQAFANDLKNSEALIAVTSSSNRSKGDKDPALWLPAKEQCKYVENWVDIKVTYSLSADDREFFKLKSLMESCGLGVLRIPASSGNPTFTVSEITVTPNTVSIADGPATVVATITIISTNPINQTRLPEPYFYQSSDIQGTRVNGKWILISGTTTDGTYQATVTIPSGTLSGGWNAGCTGFTDTSGFSSTNGGYLSSFRVIKNSEPPQEVAAKPITAGAFCSPAGATGKSTSGVTYTCKTSPTDTRNRWRQ